MKNAGIEAINRVSISEEDLFGCYPRILWVNAASSETKYTLNLKPHNHTFFELHVIAAGSIVYRFNDTEITVSGGQLMFIPPHVIHCIPYASSDFQKMTVAFEVEGELFEALASKGMVTWAKENAALSGLGEAPIRYIVDDCVKFVEREIRRGNRYDAVIMDPPSYGRGPKGEIWKIEEQIHSFVQLTTQVLKDEPLFFLINSYTTGLQPALLSYLLGTELRKFSGHIESSEIGLPVRDSGLVLPCGASGRFEAK